MRFDPVKQFLQMMAVERNAAIFGDKLHVLVADAGDMPAASVAAALPARLAQAGIEASTPQPIRPGLEDVFVQLVSRENRRATSERTGGGAA